MQMRSILERFTVAAAAALLPVMFPTGSSVAQDELWGAWRVDLTPFEGESSSSDVSIWPRQQVTCFRNARQQCLYRWQPADEGGYMTLGAAGHQHSYVGVRAAAFAGPTLTIENEYWPKTWYLDQLVGNGASFSGQYSKDGEVRGKSNWRRLQTSIERIEISPLGLGWNKSGGASFRPGAQLRVEGTFDPFDWSASNSMRGNRPTFTVRIYGQNVGPLMAVEMPFAPGFEPFNPAPITNEAGEIVGVRTEIALWPGSRPGIKRLLINGEPYEIDIVLDGYDRASTEDRCGPEYFEQLQQVATARLARFQRETAPIVGPDPAFRLFKEKSYVRTGNVSFEENARISDIEKIVEEVIAERGADVWLRETRTQLLMRYRLLIEAYLEAGRRNDGCLNLAEFANMHSLIHTRIGEISQPHLRDHEESAADAAELTRRFTEVFRRKVYETNVSIVDALRDKAITFEQTEALRENMDALKRELAQAASDGKKPSRAELELKVKAAYAAAGIPEDVAASAMDDEALLGGWLGWAWGSTFDLTAEVSGLAKAAPTVSGALSAWGLLVSLNDIVFSVVDLGTLWQAKYSDMPLAINLMQNTAHLEDLVRRYRQFRMMVTEFDDDLKAIL